MSRTSITVRLDEDVKEHFSEITEAMGKSNQGILNEFIEGTNDRFKIVTEMTDTELRDKINRTITLLDEAGTIQTEAPIPELPIKGKIAFLARAMQVLQKNDEEIFQQKYSDLRDEYEYLPDQNEIYLTGANMHLLSHISIEEALELETEQILQKSDEAILPVTLRFLALLAEKVAKEKPEIIYKVGKYDYGEEQGFVLENEDLKAESVPHNNNQVRVELMIPYYGIKEGKNKDM